MANIYLKLDDITGETKATGYEEQIELLSFSYSCYQPVNEQRGGTVANATGRCHHGTINCSKYTDAATTDLLMKMWSGSNIENGILTVVTNKGKTDEVLECLKLTLSNVLVANYSVHGGGGGGSLSNEELSLSFSAIKIEYNTLANDGETPGVKAAQWDLSTENG